LMFRKPKVKDDSWDSTFSNSSHFDSVWSAPATEN